jgi:hypothetical protein
MFKDQPLFKLGYSRDILMRADHFGSRLFDLKSSCLVQSNDRREVVALEKTLKRSFTEYRKQPVPPLRDGNKEVFELAAFPLMIQFIESLQKTSPEAGYQITKDISAITRKPPEPPPSPSPPKPAVTPKKGLLVDAAGKVVSIEIAGDDDVRKYFLGDVAGRTRLRLDDGTYIREWSACAKGTSPGVMIVDAYSESLERVDLPHDYIAAKTAALNNGELQE